MLVTIDTARQFAHGRGRSHTNRQPGNLPVTIDRAGHPRQRRAAHMITDEIFGPRP